jgi:hypothetical protein
MFAAIGRELTALEDTQSVFTTLSQAAVQRVPGAQLAGITIGRGGVFKTVGATSDVANRIDAIQYDLGSGPCVDAIVHNTVFRADDLRADQRWPEFGQLAFAAEGIVSMLSLRIYVEGDESVVAGLNMYSTETAAFGESASVIAVLLATHGAIAVVAAAAREKAANLKIALRTSREIGVAMGIIMTRQKVDREQAFDLLRIASQHGHRKLAAVATEVAETGQLPDLPGSADGDPADG